MITEQDFDRLAALIRDNIRKDFENKHLSKNLINTMKISVIDGEIKIDIPAKTYNMLLFQQKGVVVHTNHGSYANDLNEKGSEFFIYPQDSRKGSFQIKPHNHVGFIDRAINYALWQWINSLPEKYTMVVDNK